MSDRPPGRPDEPRKLRGKDERAYVIGGIVIIIGVGGGLIALFYGSPALWGALPCMLGLIGIGVFLWLLLKLLEYLGREPD